MIRNLLPWTAGCLLAAFAVSSCESDDVDYGPISAAIEIGVEEVTPSSAKIRLTTEQENVASYKIVKPTPISEFEYAATPMALVLIEMFSALRLTVVCFPGMSKDSELF